MSSLEDFPNEVLEMVFGHITSRSDMLMLTETSPRMNDVISNSFWTMVKIGVIWNYKKEATLEVPSKRRKYKFLRVQTISGCSAKLKKFFETFSDSLIGIQFLSCKFRMFDLHTLLSMAAPTLENLSFIKTLVVKQKQDQVLKCEMPQLKRLRFDGSEGGCDVMVFISSVPTSTLKAFMYDDVIEEQEAAENTTNQVNFTKRQKRLTHISLRPSFANAKVEYLVTEDGFVIELDHRFLDNPGVIQTVNFATHWKFLQSQRKTLRSLDLVCTKFEGEELQDLLSFELEQLALHRCFFSWKDDRATENHTIQAIVLNYSYGDTSDDCINAINQMLLSCKGLVCLETIFKGCDDRLKPVLKTIANKTSITSLIVHCPDSVNVATFPAVEVLGVGIGNTGKDEMDKRKEGILRLVQANPHINVVSLDIKLKDDTAFKVLLERSIPSTITIEYIDYLNR